MSKDKEEKSWLPELTSAQIYQSLVDNLNKELAYKLKIPYTIDSIKNSNIGSFILTIVKSLLIQRNMLLGAEGSIRTNLSKVNNELIYSGGSSIKGLVSGLLKLTIENKTILQYTHIAESSIAFPDIEKGSIVVVIQINDDVKDLNYQEILINFLGTNVSAGIITTKYSKDEKNIIEGSYIEEGMIEPINIYLNLVEIVKMKIIIKGTLYNQTIITDSFSDLIKQTVYQSFNNLNNKLVLTASMFSCGEVFNNLTNIEVFIKLEGQEKLINITKTFYAFPPTTRPVLNDVEFIKNDT